MHPSMTSSTSNVILKEIAVDTIYFTWSIDRISSGQEDIRSMLGARHGVDGRIPAFSRAFPTPCYGSAVKIADNCWRLLVDIIIDN